MPGAQLSRRHFSIRARESHRKVQKGSKKVVVSFGGDLINPKLIPIKITFFLLMGATQCFAPYVTLLKKALGLTVEETALVFTIGSLIPIVAPFLAGLITDRVGNFRTFLVITVALSGIFGLIVIFIPPARTTTVSDVSESDTQFELTCEDNFKISYELNSRCQTPNMVIKVDVIHLYDCGYKCSPALIQIEGTRRIDFKNLTMEVYHNATTFVSCRISKSTEQKCFLYYLNSSKSSKTDETSYSQTEFTLKNVIVDFPMTNKAKAGEIQEMELKNYDISNEDLNRFGCESGFQSADVTWRPLKISTGVSTLPKLEKLKMVTCKFHCQGLLPLNKTCNQTTPIVEHDISLSIGLFIFSNALSNFMIGLTYTMFEAGVVAITREYSYDYGLQRIYGTIGGMVFAPATGFLIDYFGTKSYSDYYVGYFFYCGLKLVCAIILTKLDLRFKTPAKRICGNISNVFLSIESVLLVFVVFFSGTCYGFIENFLPWHMNNLGAENWVIGLMTTVASCSALPFIALSDPICRKFGHIQSICFGLICYSIRCLGYSMIINPLWCYPFEVLEGMTTGLLVAAAIIYGSKLSSQNNVGTLQGILAASHYGLGKSAGSSLGGFMMAKLTAKIAFRVFSGLAFTVAFIYYLIYKLVLLPRNENRRLQVCDMHVEVVPSKNISETFQDLKTMSTSNTILMTSTPVKQLEVPA